MTIQFSQVEYDVTSIGNALVDIIASATDDFLRDFNIKKGGMCLISAEEAVNLYNAMGPAKEISGGSAANSMAGLASLGGKAAFIGKIADDTVGHIFAHDIKATGVDFQTKPYYTEDAYSGRCYILVTPDAERTMQTYLGVSGQIVPEDLDIKKIKNSKILYLEGYLWDLPETISTLRQSIEIAKNAGCKVALTLSDTFVVDRHRSDFIELLSDKIDILFANESEIQSLFEVTNFDDALDKIKDYSHVLAALTRSAKGCIVTYQDELHIIESHRIDKVVDTTGAGDLFAAGFFYGITHNMNLQESAMLASLCAGEVISHYGARPEMNLKEFVEQNSHIKL